MNIGVVPFSERLGGGSFQYSQSLLQALVHPDAAARGDRYIIFIPEERRDTLPQPLPPHCTVCQLLPPRRRIAQRLRAIVGEGAHRELWRRWRATRDIDANAPPDPDTMKSQPDMNEWFLYSGAEFMVYAAHEVLNFEAGLPYLCPVHDFEHRIHPQFPEVTHHNEQMKREYLYRNIARSASCVLVDSETGKEDMLRFYGEYGIGPDRVRVLPFLPSPALAAEVSAEERADIRRRHNLPERFFFYPAQFWPHKNHRRIVEALALLRERDGLDTGMVFAGTYDDEIRRACHDQVAGFCRERGLEPCVRFLGYVPDADMAGLYSEAVALVMPTFAGPTNIPVLEAWRHGCPVLTSDQRGNREQAGDAALLVDPESVEAIASGMKRLWQDEALRADLAARGRARVSAYGPDDFRGRLLLALRQALSSPRRFTPGNPL